MYSIKGKSGYLRQWSTRQRLMNARNGAEITAFGGVTETLQIGSPTIKMEGLCSIHPKLGSYWDGSTELS